jgi:uncharacterized membrane protein YozB (DUF420 family)
MIFLFDLNNLKLKTMDSLKSPMAGTWRGMPTNINGKVILFLIMALMFVSVVIFDEIPLVMNKGGRHKHLASIRWILLPHGILGFIGLVLGPLQFSSRIREHNYARHRMLGKIYVTAILTTSLLSIIIATVYSMPGGTPRFVFENCVQGSVWFLTTLMAFILARNRQIGLHKIWMARSYGVTFVFVMARVLDPTTFMQKMGIEAFTDFLYFTIIIGLVVPDILLNWKAIFIRKKETQHELPA